MIAWAAMTVQGFFREIREALPGARWGLSR